MLHAILHPFDSAVANTNEFICLWVSFNSCLVACSYVKVWKRIFITKENRLSNNEILAEEVYNIGKEKYRVGEEGVALKPRLLLPL